MTQAALIALIQTCVGSMHGAHFVGDPSNLPVLRGYVIACSRAADDLSLRRPLQDHELKRRELLAIVLDREVVLSYAGMGDAATALPAAKAELRNLGELLKIATDGDEIHAFEDQADLVGGQIQTLIEATKKKT